MGSLTKLWAGRIYGTNTGNIFISLEETGPALKGTLRLNDPQFGVAQYALEGSYDEQIVFKGTPITKPNDGIGFGIIEATAYLTPEGNLRGQWVSTLGTGGTFDAYPHEQDSASQSQGNNSSVPEQFYTHNITLGAVTLYEADVRALIANVSKDFVSGRPIVTYSTGAAEVTKYAEDFLSEISGLGVVSFLKVNIQEPEAHGINKVVVVEFNAYGLNVIRAQGVNESWVIGRAEALGASLRRHKDTLVTTYKRFGLNINEVIFMAVLVAIPEIDSWLYRALFVATVFALLTGLLKLHSRFITNARIHLGTVSPSRISRHFPSILSWFFGILATVIASLIYTWLMGQAS